MYEMLNERTPEQESAHDRAEDLLTSWLTDEQLLSWRAHNYFDVTGSHTGATYRIHRGDVYNVEEIGPSSVHLQQLCFGPILNPINFLRPPIPDTNLAQKIILENDEEQALYVCNKANQMFPQYIGRRA